MNEALSLGDKVLIIQDGRNVTYSTPKNLINYPLNINIAQISSFNPITFEKGKIINKKLFVDNQELVLDELYSLSVRKDYDEVITYKNGDTYVAFEELSVFASSFSS